VNWKPKLLWVPDTFILGITGLLAILTVLGALVIRAVPESGFKPREMGQVESPVQAATRTEVRTIIEKQFTTGVVSRVIDGDTVEMDIEGKLVNVRLFGVDAPELDQPFGFESKDALARRILGEEIIIVPRDIDRYDRLVAGLYRSTDKGILSINSVMTYAGFVCAYRDYLGDELEYYLLYETDAKKHKRGIWAAAGAVSPWDWRKQRKGN
jgi:endonuclease YncB( thermonuclease family)